MVRGCEGDTGWARLWIFPLWYRKLEQITILEEQREIGKVFGADSFSGANVRQ